MEKNNLEITHKELLTFSNLTNFEWEFVDLEGIKKRRKTGEEGEENQSTQLKDLLIPGVFARTVEENGTDRRKYSYGDTGDEDYDKELGLAEMRQKAGIAMEYKEKLETGNQEGEFLKEWEVVYAADNYKAVADYLDYKWESISQYAEVDKDKKIYPTREDLKEGEEKKAGIEFKFKAGEFGLSVVMSAVGLNEAVNLGRLDITRLLKNASREVSTEILSDELKDYFLSAILLCYVYGIGDAKKLLGGELSSEERKVLGKTTEELTKNLAKAEGGLPEKITEEISMEETGFRVVVFKKENEAGKDQIVISYQGKKNNEDKTMPKEFDLLQMVYNQMQREHPNSEVVLTGFDQGANFAFLNSLFIDHRQEYIVKEGDTLSSIAQDLFGDPYLWRDKFEKKNGEKFGSDEIIVPGEKVYYDRGDYTTGEAKLFYSNLADLKQYLNFTWHDMGQPPQKLKQVLIKAGRKTPKIAIKTALAFSLGVGLRKLFSLFALCTGPKGVAIKIIITTIKAVLIKLSAELLINRLKANAQEDRLKKQYEYLKEQDFIREEEKGIKGYITDKFFETEYLEIPVYDVDYRRNGIRQTSKSGFKEIKVKKDIALQIMWDSYDGQSLPSNSDDSIRGLEGNLYLYRGQFALVKGKKEYELKKVLPKEDYRGPIESVFDIYDLKPLSSQDRLKLSQGWMTINLIELIAEMQGNYEKKKDNLFGFIYLTKEGIKTTKSLPQGTKLKDKFHSAQDEFAFMPYLQLDSNGKVKAGDIGTKLSRDYIGSVVKSMIHKYKGFNKYHNNPYKKRVKVDGELINLVKYGSEEAAKDYFHDFAEPLDNFDLNKKLLSFMTEQKFNPSANGVLRANREYGASFEDYFETYTYQRVLTELKENPNLLADYYRVQRVDKPKKFKEATHLITIRPNYKESLEYKYNSLDDIVKGELKIYLTEAVTEVSEEGITTTAVSSVPKDKEEKEEDKIIVGDKISPGTKFKEKKRIINNLNENSSVAEIKRAAEVVIDEAKRKRKPVIGEAIEDYLSCMYNQKRVKPKKLRTLDAVKTAEKELKIDLERKLVWKINDILATVREFKPYEELRFSLRKSRLVNPVSNNLTGFLNASRQSRLKVKADFVLEKVLNRKKLELKGKMTYKWKNNYRWIGGRKKYIANYGWIADYQFRKLASKGAAKPYRMYAQWNYYLEDSISLHQKRIDYIRYWPWDDLSIFTYI